MPRIAAASACYRISILLRALRAACPCRSQGISREVAMDIVHPRVAGIDVHKKVIWVAVRLPGAAPGERKVVVRSFKTFWRSLQKMAAWLAELGVTDAAMESTGVYWWPVYHALAQAGRLRCACATRRTCAMSRAGKPTSGTASGSLSCMSTGCCGPASSRRPAGGGVTGAHQVPQEADRAPRLGGPAAVEGAGGRRDQDRFGGLGAAGRSRAGT